MTNIEERAVNDRKQIETRDRIRWQIPSNPKYISWVRQSIYNLALIYGFKKRAALDLKILSGEAINNIITHAYGGSTEKAIFIEILMFGDHIEIRYQDFGKQTPVTKSHIQDLSDYRQRGLGVYLISKLADYHFYDQSAKTGTTLVIKKRLTK